MAHQTSEQIAEQEARVDRLQAAADDATGHVRNLYVAFLTFALYLTVTIGGTTDEQLLRGDPVRLPVVNVEISLFAFYWIAPLLFVLFHFNLLMQLYLLSEKLHPLGQAMQRLPEGAERERRATLSQFVFTQMVIRQHRRSDRVGSVTRLLLSVIGWTTFVVLPIAVLQLAGVQFLPYHDRATTWAHRVFLAIDLVLVWVLWLGAIEPRNRLVRLLWRVGRERWRRLESGRTLRELRVIGRRRGRQMRRRLAEPLDWPAWPVIRIIALFDRLRRRFFGQPIRAGGQRRDWRLLRFQEVSVVCLLIAFLIATIPEEFLAKPLDALIGPDQSLPLVARNLSAPEAKLVLRIPEPSVIESIGEPKALEKYTDGLDLRDRDLRFVNLHNADVRKADLRGANLQGANLASADLRGTNLESADLQVANFGWADLRGASLRKTDLRGTDLSAAHLQGADFTEAVIWGGVLRWADLGGAILNQADLRGAILEHADLRGAILEHADLRGAPMKQADFRGAILEGADLRGAFLFSADLQGANLRLASLWRTFTGGPPDRDVLWHLADLRGAAAAEAVDLGALIAEMRQEMPDEPTRIRVLYHLEFAFRDDDRPDVPSWHGQPEVMFWSNDPIPVTLDWRTKMSDEEYDKQLAIFLADLACEDGNPAVTEGLARRVTRGGYSGGGPGRLLNQLVAQRLTPDRTDDCPAAADLPEDLRSRLKGLAARLPSSDVEEPGSEQP